MKIIANMYYFDPSRSSDGLSTNKFPNALRRPITMSGDYGFFQPTIIRSPDHRFKCDLDIIL